MVKSKAAKAAKKAIQKPPKPRTLAANDRDNATAEQDDQLSLSLQQNLLNVFSDACINGSTSEIELTLQEVKGHLYNRDFAAAFGKDEYLRVYAARWSPSRALGYAQVFHDIEKFLIDQQEGEKSSKNRSLIRDNQSEDVDLVASEMSFSAKPSDHAEDTAVQHRDIQGSSNSLRIVCLGGGAGAELVGLAGWLKTIEDLSPERPLSNPLEVLCLDIAHWANVMNDLHERCITAPKLSKYASAAAQASNAALLTPGSLQVDFRQQDILNYTSAEVKMNFSDTDLVTIMFTLNELYSHSVSKAQRLLHDLTASMKMGSLLLVVDSPGSYSAVTINGAERKYPMQWLLDHTLLDPPSKASGLPPKIFWEKLLSDESRWFRLQKELLKYPIDLENMRYQIHLYRRCEAHT